METETPRQKSATFRGSSPAGTPRGMSGKSSRKTSPGTPKGTPPQSRKKLGSANTDHSSARSSKERGRSSEKRQKKITIKTPDVLESGLKRKVLSGEGLTVVPMNVIGEKDIGELYLDNNNLRNLPSEVKRWTTLQKLDISKNGIRCVGPRDFSGLPLEMQQLTHLTDLNISECNMPYIPYVIWKITSLKFLDISRNKINELPHEIGNLRSLQKLNLKHTNLASLPPEIAYCQELEEILLWGNTMESLPETLPEMPKLHTLALNYRSFCGLLNQSYMENYLSTGQIKSEHIPAVVFELPALISLDLENTKINNLNETQNISLRELNLSRNFLQQLPLSVYRLNHLTLVDLSYNHIESLPDEIGQVKSLLKLRISNNKIKQIPNTIGQLDNLIELDLGSNALTSITPSIRYLGSLKTLILEENRLEALPDEICDLVSLETLDVSCNSITALPMKLHQLKQLTCAHSFSKLRKQGLWLYKNPLTQPPPEVWRTDKPKKIFEYLKKLAIIKTENLQRQKMLVLGESNSGKTSFVWGLVHGKSLMAEQERIKTKRKLQQKKEEEANKAGKAVPTLPPEFQKEKSNLDLETPTSHRQNSSRTPNRSKSPSLTHRSKSASIRSKSPKLLSRENSSADKSLGPPSNFQTPRSKSISVGFFEDKVENDCTISDQLEEFTRAQKQMEMDAAENEEFTRRKKRPEDEEPDMRTRFIEQTIWKTENAVEFVINDFGGDSTYSMCYPMMLDAKSLVVLVYDHSKYTQERHHMAIGQWIDLLNIHTPGTVVQIVGTKADLCENEEIEEETTEILRNEIEKQKIEHKEHLQQQLHRTQKEIEEIQSRGNVNTDQLDHLTIQKEKLQFLIDNPIKIMDEISVINTLEGLHGINKLISSIELLAIDASLFPHAQGCMPGNWNKFKVKLKQQKSYYLLWKDVKEIAKGFNISEDKLDECIHYLHDIGEVLWFHDIPGLAPILFHKPRILVEFITTLYRHDYDTFFNFEENKIFMSKGNFKEDTFNASIEIFQNQGIVSRPLLNSLWFYQKLDYESFHDLLVLLPLFDITYTVPEPEVPLGSNACTPLLVLPWYNRQMAGADLDEVWEETLPQGDILFSVIFEFPFSCPKGFFERLSAALQDHVITRADWKDAVIGTTEDDKCLLQLLSADNNGGDKLRVVVKGKGEERLETFIGELTQMVSNIITRVQGLTWRIKASTQLWDHHKVSYLRKHQEKQIT